MAKKIKGTFRSRGRANISKPYYSNYKGELEKINSWDNPNRTLYVTKLSENYLKSKNESNPYKYIITADAQSHTAFHTDKGYKNYLKNYGLKEDKSNINKGNFGESYKLKGYDERIYFKGTAKQLDDFGKSKNYKPIAVLDNGTYTRGYSDGDKVYLLNTNYPRKELKYRWE